MKKPTRGGQLLSRSLAPTRSELAKKLGVTPQALSGWINGDFRPGPESMRELEDLLGIPMRSWTEEPTPTPPERDVAQTGRGFADGTRTKPVFVGEDADSTPSNPEANDAA